MSRPPTTPPAAESAPPAPVFATVADILAKAQITEATPFIDLLGQNIRIRQITKAELDRLRVAHTHKGTFDEAGSQRDLLRLCLMEPQLTVAEVEALWAGMADLADALLKPIMALNHLGPEDWDNTLESFRSG